MQQVFISFAGEDADLAAYLAQTFDDLFSGTARFFFAPAGVEPGAVWLDRLRSEARQADLVLLLLGPRSFDRPWLNIEAGAFWVSGKDMHPLLHGGLQASDLHRPLADYQAVDIHSPSGIGRLIGSLAARFGMTDPPRHDAATIVGDINARDRGAMKRFGTWADMAQELGTPTDEPVPEQLDRYRISKELDSSSFRVLRNHTLEVNGYSNDSMLFALRDPEPRRDLTHLVIRCHNTAGTRSLEYGLFLKVLLNNEVLLPFFPFHRHSRDEQFTGLGDGFVPYEISWVDGARPEIQLVLWRAHVRRLRMELYLV